MRWYLLLAALLFASPALAQDRDTCTLSGGGVWAISAHVFTDQATWGATADTDCGGGTLDPNDRVVIADGAIVYAMITTDYTQGTAWSETGIEIQGSAKVHFAAAVETSEIELSLGQYGLTAASGTTVTVNGSHLTFENSPTWYGFETSTVDTNFTDYVLYNPELAPSTEDYAAVGDVVHCPGWDNSATENVTDCSGLKTDPSDIPGDPNKIAICWPAAKYDIAADNSDPGGRFYPEWTAALDVDNHLCFYDPTDGVAPQRDWPWTCYSIVRKDAGDDNNCLVLAAHGGCTENADCPYNDPNLPVTTLNPVELTATADMPAGSTVLESFGTGVVTGSHEYAGRSLTCDDGFGAYPGWSVNILKIENGTDTIHVAPPIPQTISNTDVCYIDFGWASGDPLMAMNFMTFTSATSGSDALREDTDVTLQGAVELHGALFSTIGGGPGGSIRLGGTATTDRTLGTHNWFRDGKATNMVAVSPADRATLLRWYISGGGDGDGQDHASIILDADSATIKEWHVRFSQDDAFQQHPSAGFTDDLFLDRIRVSYTAGHGSTSGNFFASNGNSSSPVTSNTSRGRDFVCDDCQPHENNTAGALLECNEGCGLFQNITSIGNASRFGAGDGYDDLIVDNLLDLYGNSLCNMSGASVRCSWFDGGLVRNSWIEGTYIGNSFAHEEQNFTNVMLKEVSWGNNASFTNLGPMIAAPARADHLNVMVLNSLRDVGTDQNGRFRMYDTDEDCDGGGVDCPETGSMYNISVIFDPPDTLEIGGGFSSGGGQTVDPNWFRFPMDGLFVYGLQKTATVSGAYRFAAADFVKIKTETQAVGKWNAWCAFNNDTNLEVFGGGAEDVFPPNSRMSEGPPFLAREVDNYILGGRMSECGARKYGLSRDSIPMRVLGLNWRTYQAGQPSGSGGSNLFWNF